MTANCSTLAKGWRWPLGFAASYMVLSFISEILLIRSPGTAYLWPATGIAVGACIVLEGAARRAFLALAGMISFGLNVYFGATPWTAVVFAVAHLIEATVAGSIASGRARVNAMFDDPRWLARFTLGTVLASALATGFVTVMPGNDWRPDAVGRFARAWFSTALIGMLVVAPAAVLSWRWLQGRLSGSDRPLVLHAALVPFVFGAALLTFGQSEVPLLFLPIVAVLVATFVQGVTGAVFSVFIVTLVATYFTVRGAGPIPHFTVEGLNRAEFLQGYVLLLLIASVPMSSLLANARRIQASLREKNRLLETVERIAEVGHWRHDLASDTVIWSDAVYRIHGKPAGVPVTLKDRLGSCHPDDREKVLQAYAHTIETLEPFAFDTRIIRDDGAVRHVQSHGEPEVENGKLVAILGVFLDITDRVNAMEELQQARKIAQDAAQDAMIQAGTDQLTGIANRRAFLECLDAAISEADQTGNALSLIAFDIDHFKSINDAFGHPAGDDVIIGIAQAAAGCLRGTDLIGRIGGEEFAVVLPGANVRVAQAIAERIRAAVHALDFDIAGLGTVSISLGVGGYQRGADATWLIQAADVAMYQAKREGRNRTRLAA